MTGGRPATQEILCRRFRHLLIPLWLVDCLMRKIAMVPGTYIRPSNPRQRIIISWSWVRGFMVSGAVVEMAVASEMYAGTLKLLNGTRTMWKYLFSTII